MNINDKSELIDKYLREELSPAEKASFEKQLASDPKLADEVRELQVLLKNLHIHEDLKGLQELMNKSHEALKSASVKREYYKQRKPDFHFIWQLAAAASVSLLIVLSTLYFSGWFKFDQQAKSYTELKNDVKEISKSQRQLKSAILADEKSAPAKFSGTCFAISEDGYLATNYHLVKNLDSVYVLNISDSLTRYKATLVYYDINYDLAVLKISDSLFNGFRKIPYTFTGRFSELGEPAFTLGYSKNDLVYGDGAISSLTGFEEDTIAYQVTIPVNPGNSGSPLISSEGEILGVIIGKHSQKAGATYAVKSSYLLNVLENLKPDSVQTSLKLPVKNRIKNFTRTEQIKRIRPYIFMVEVY